MTPLQKADLFLQMYGQYFHYHRQMQDDIQELAFNFLICKNVSEVLQKENIDFSIKLFEKRTGHPYPAIVIDDIVWSIDGPLYLNTQESEFSISELPSSYSPSDFIEKFNEKYSDYLYQEALRLEKNGFKDSLSFSLEKKAEPLSASFLSVQNSKGETEARLLFQNSELLDSVLSNPLHSMNSQINSFDDYRYIFTPVEESKASLDPLFDFFYLDAKSNFSTEEVSKMFYDLPKIPSSRMGSHHLEDTFNSIREIIPQLRSEPNANTVSLFFAPAPYSVTETDYQRNAFHYNFEVESERDLERIKKLLIESKNVNFFGMQHLRHFSYWEDGLADIRTPILLGNFITPTNAAHHSKKYMCSLNELDPQLPLIGHLPPLLQTLEYHKHIRPVFESKKTTPTPRF